MIRFPALLALACTLSAPVLAQNPSVPKKHQALYDTLNAQVAAFQHRLARVTRDQPLLRGAPLTALGCEHAAADVGNEARWQTAAQELDALRRAGVQAIALNLCYPLLSPGFQEPQPLMERYANLANQVRLRDMKLLVQHKALSPTSATVQSRRYYQRMSKQRFLRERYEEAKSIVLALQPDYLTLVSDPREDAAGLKLSARDWRGYLQRASTDLRRELGDFVPPLGAGLGLWGETSTLETFASVPGLAYIDLRFYPARAGNEDLFDRLLAWPDRVRAIDPGKRIVLSEAWLYKSSPVESFRGTPELNIVAREAFGFWSPLDSKFLQALGQAARIKDVEVVVAARPRYFFAYLDFFDPAIFRASPRLLDELATQRAASAMERGELTATGRAFGAM